MQGYQPYNPAVKCGMVNDYAAFRHHFFEITQTQGVSQIPANTLCDDIDGVMQAFECVSNKRHEQATPQKNSMLPEHPPNATEPIHAGVRLLPDRSAACGSVYLLYQLSVIELFGYWRKFDMQTCRHADMQIWLMLMPSGSFNTLF
jgi:hypothetical protein